MFYGKDDDEPSHEERLERAQNTYNSLQDLANDGVITHDPEAWAQVANKRNGLCLLPKEYRDS